MNYLLFINEEKKCKYCGDKSVYAVGYCKQCYQRDYKYGSPEGQIRFAEKPEKVSINNREKRIKKMNPQDSRGGDMLTLYKSGLTLKDIGEKYDISPQRVWQILYGKEEKEIMRIVTEEEKERNELICKYYEEGNSVINIGKEFGITAQRVYQIIRYSKEKKAGVSQCSNCGDPVIYCKGFCRRCYAKNYRHSLNKEKSEKKACSSDLKNKHRQKIILSMDPVTQRGMEMLDLYKSGKTVREIGSVYGITGSRVHQILHGQENPVRKGEER